MTKIGKYKNWRASIEGDYFSLYIKTWFAFLSTLHELYPEKKNNKGDGDLILHSSENIQVHLNYNEVILPSIKSMYSASELVMKSNHNKYYFSSFYELNKNYRYKQKEIDGHIDFLINKTKKDFASTSTGTSKRTKDQLYFEIRSNQKQFLKHLKPIIDDDKSYTLNARIDLGEIIRANTFDDKYSIINLAKQKLNENINALFVSRGHTQKQQEMASEFFKKIIESSFQTWAQDFESDNLFKKLPNKSFPDTETNKKQTLKWFIRFSYKLRNVLFHSIIDPFDEQWQLIYKNTYIALKELVDNNIIMIKENSEKEIPQQNNTS